MDDFLALKCDEIGDVEAAVAEFKMPQTEEVQEWLFTEEPENPDTTVIRTLHHHEGFLTIEASAAGLDRSVNVEIMDVSEIPTVIGLDEFLKAEKRKVANESCKKSRDKK